MSDHPATAATAGTGPLAGLKVIEICNTIAGPACARLLADFGADVIKIEPPEGDPVRQMGRHVGDVSLYAASILRNKRSIALDLKTPQGRRTGRRADRPCRHPGGKQPPRRDGTPGLGL
jgi:crotonobetainyl-CoA:carnitine CoA-transferase CaiB-like acyl-CoA transferase